MLRLSHYVSHVLIVADFGIESEHIEAFPLDKFNMY